MLNGLQTQSESHQWPDLCVFSILVACIFVEQWTEELGPTSFRTVQRGKIFISYCW